MELDGYLSCSQEDTTYSSPEPAESSPHPSVLILKSHFTVILLRLGLPSRLFSAGCLTKSRYLFVFLVRATCLTKLTLFVSIALLILVEQVLAPSIAQSAVLTVLMAGTVLSRAFTGLR